MSAPIIARPHALFKGFYALPQRYRARVDWIAREHKKRGLDVGLRFSGLVALIDGLTPGLRGNSTESDIKALALQIAGGMGLLPAHAARRLRGEQREFLLEADRQLGGGGRLWAAESKALRRARHAVAPAPGTAPGRHRFGNSVTRPSSPARFAEERERNNGAHEFFTEDLGWPCIAVSLSAGHLDAAHNQPSRGWRADANWSGLSLGDQIDLMKAQINRVLDRFRKAGIPCAVRKVFEVSDSGNLNSHLRVYAPPEHSQRILNGFYSGFPGVGECHAQLAAQVDPTGWAWVQYSEKDAFAKDGAGRYLRTQNGDYVETPSARMIRDTGHDRATWCGLPPVGKWRESMNAGYLLLDAVDACGVNVLDAHGPSDLALMGAAVGFKVTSDGAIQRCPRSYREYLRTAFDVGFVPKAHPLAVWSLDHALSLIFKPVQDLAGDFFTLVSDQQTGAEIGRIPATSEWLENGEKSPNSLQGVVASKVVSTTTYKAPLPPPRRRVIGAVAVPRPLKKPQKWPYKVPIPKPSA